MIRIISDKVFPRVLKISSVIICIFLMTTFLFSKPYNILDGESPYTLQQYSAEARLMLGYETGYIPDAFMRPWLDLGILNWLTFGGGIYCTYFIDQDKYSISEWEIRGKFRFLRIKSGDTQMFGYVKFRQSNETVFGEYTGSLSGITAVVSPRADGGWDFTAGVTGRAMFNLYGHNIGVFATADYAWTGGRDYVPEELEYQNRFSANIMPVYYMNFIPPKYVKKDSLLFGIQNRFTYWFDRGDMYNVMPQVSWEFHKTVTLSAGVSLPVNAGNDYRYLAEISARLELFTMSAKISVDPETDFTPDGNKINDVLNIKPSVKSSSDIVKWKILVKDKNRVIKIFRGTGPPPEKIAWDGKSETGELVESLKQYKIHLSASDKKGNRDEDETSVTVGFILQEITNGYKIVIRSIEFDTGKDIIKTNAYTVLNKIAVYLNSGYSDYNIKVEGHTDNVGKPESNLDLSIRRAKSVMVYLRNKGIAKDRISYAGYGEAVPVADNNTEDGRARNRRVEFILQKKGQ